MARTKEAQRKSAAESVCWSLMLMLELGALDNIPIEWRKVLGDPLQEWCELCVATGQMKPGEDEEGERKGVVGDVEEEVKEMVE